MTAAWPRDLLAVAKLTYTQRAGPHAASQVMPCPHSSRSRCQRASAASRGQNVVEYGMIIAAVAIVVLLGVTTFGSEIRPWFEHLAAGITTVGT